MAKTELKAYIDKLIKFYQIEIKVLIHAFPTANDTKKYLEVKNVSHQAIKRLKSNIKEINDLSSSSKLPSYFRSEKVENILTEPLEEYLSDLYFLKARCNIMTGNKKELFFGGDKEFYENYMDSIRHYNQKNIANGHILSTKS
ncbi:MAG: hypothetical protein RCG15_01505 [Candidatus Rickettsia vulgarisii]